MHHMHTGEAVVTRKKNDIFMLVTTRPMTHSGRFVCIQNCVGKLGTDTGQLIVTSNGMSYPLSDNHKAYYTCIEIYIQMYNAMCHMDAWENFGSATRPIFLLSEGLQYFQECVCTIVFELLCIMCTQERPW